MTAWVLILFLAGGDSRSTGIASIDVPMHTEEACELALASILAHPRVDPKLAFGVCVRTGMPESEMPR